MAFGPGVGTAADTVAGPEVGTVAAGPVGGTGPEVVGTVVAGPVGGTGPEVGTVVAGRGIVATGQGIGAEEGTAVGQGTTAEEGTAAGQGTTAEEGSLDTAVEEGSADNPVVGRILEVLPSADHTALVGRTGAWAGHKAAAGTA